MTPEASTCCCHGDVPGPRNGEGSGSWIHRGTNCRSRSPCKATRYRHRVVLLHNVRWLIRREVVAYKTIPLPTRREETSSQLSFSRRVTESRKESRGPTSVDGYSSETLAPSRVADFNGVGVQHLLLSGSSSPSIQCFGCSEERDRPMRAR